MLCVSIGILFGFVAGTYLAYFLVPKIFAPFPIIFFASFFFFPETPQYFISRKNFEVHTKYKLYPLGITHSITIFVIRTWFLFLFRFRKRKVRCDSIVVAVVIKTKTKTVQ